MKLRIRKGGAGVRRKKQTGIRNRNMKHTAERGFQMQNKIQNKKDEKAKRIRSCRKHAAMASAGNPRGAAAANRSNCCLLYLIMPVTTLLKSRFVHCRMYVSEVRAMYGLPGCWLLPTPIIHMNFAIARASSR